MTKEKQDKLIESLAESRLFFGNLAFSVSRRHGAEAAKRFNDLCASIDDAIRALRDSQIIAEVLPKDADMLDLTAYRPRLISKTIQ